MLNSFSKLTDGLWRIFVSVRLTIVILILMMLSCIVGTMVAQQGQTQLPIEKLYKPEVLKWLVTFGLTDIFHSPFFIFLLLMWAMNLLACSIERLPAIWRLTFHVPAPPVSDPTLSDWSPEDAKKRKYMIVRPGNAGFETVREAKMAAMLFFQKHFGKYVVLRDREDQFQLMVEKGKFSRLGVYITHLSLLMIMTGGVTGALTGFEGAINIEEGTRVSWIQHNKGANAGLTVMRENGIPVPGFLNLGFEIECQKFELETYDGERPKAFRSILNFYENDVLVHSAPIEVNDPTVYKGITFYQASYSEVGVGGITLKVYRTEPNGPVKPARSRHPSSTTEKMAAQSTVKPPGLPPAMPQNLPTTGGLVSPSVAPTMMPAGATMPKINSVEVVENIKPGDLYRIDGNAAFKVLQIEANMMELGPGAKIQYWPTRATKKPTEFWIFKNLPGFDFAHRRDAGLNFVLDSVRPKYATGLSVARDPGVWIVWIGSGILTLALFIALYTCHSRYWVAWTRETGFVVVGWSNKLFLFEPRFEKFKAAFEKEFKV